MKFVRRISLPPLALRAVMLGLFLALSIAGAAAQKSKRDHLTENEGDQVRENQQIDQRIQVFIKAADRRLLVLTDPNATQ